MKKLTCFFLLLAATGSVSQVLSPIERMGITIVNGPSRNVPQAGPTDFDAGPMVASILNVHYFPGLLDYGNGRYDYAETQLSYVINRPQYIEQNPRQGEILSTAHYTRGMIYFYHASGVGRHRLARADFEAAIQWNPRNLVAYLELSRVFSELGLKEPAVSTIHRLLDFKPDKTIAEQAQADLKKLGVKAKQ